MTSRTFRPSDRGYTNYAIEQVWLKYGLNPTPQQWAETVADLRARRGLLMGCKKDGSEVWSVRMCDQQVKLIWDREQNTIVTFYQPTEHVRMVDRAIRANEKPRDEMVWRNGQRVKRRWA